jgi:hypothetical protein
MIVHTVDDILNKLENCIQYKLPFSHIRFGDGGIKFLHGIIYNDEVQLRDIVFKEGLPQDQIIEIMELWAYYARQADFIDTPEVYLNGKFWPRIKALNKKISEHTQQRLEMWKELYNRAEFFNENYCNPESNYLMILRRFGKRNLLNVMKGRKICVIAVKREVRKLLIQQGYNVDLIKIVGHNQNQYRRSFSDVVKHIKKNARKYDFWLVAAGELGRIYSGIIKEEGGRTIDIGYVIELWLEKYLHSRLQPFLNFSLYSPLELVLTNEGKKYEEFI